MQAAAVKAAGTGRIEHLIMDKIRQHSTRPEEACAFFTRLFWPEPSERHGCALLHVPYLAERTADMSRFTGRPGRNLQMPLGWLCGSSSILWIMQFVHKIVTTTKLMESAALVAFTAELQADSCLG